MQLPVPREPRLAPREAAPAPPAGGRRGASVPAPSVSRCQADLVRIAVASSAVSLLAAGKRRSGLLVRRARGAFSSAPAKKEPPGITILNDEDVQTPSLGHEPSSPSNLGAGPDDEAAFQEPTSALESEEDEEPTSALESEEDEEPTSALESEEEETVIRTRVVQDFVKRTRFQRKFKNTRIRWASDGRRAYINDEGLEINPHAGLNYGSSARSNGTPKEPPKPLEVEVASESVNQEEIIFGERKDFSSLGVTSKPLLKALTSLGYMYSTRVQGAAIPSVLSEERRAVVISSETGSGKTLAYLVPALELVLRRPPRAADDRHPTALILVPSLELGVQVSMVAKQLAQAIRAAGNPISVYNARRSWPEDVPDILVCTPRAAAQGLEPCTSEDEMARRQALKRIRDVELVVFDEADLLLDRGNQGKDTQIVLTAIAASFPDKPRLVQPEAQVYRPDGIPVEILTYSMEWVPGHAWHNKDGTFKVRFGDGKVSRSVRRRKLRGPGMGLLVENGPRFVASCATLPSYSRGRCIIGDRSDMQDNSFYNSGIGSVEWVLKRWYPNAVRVESPWLHRRHPGIEREAWVYIPGESRKNGGKAGTGKVNLQLRIQKTLEILDQQGPDVRTIVFASTPEACLSFEMACKSANVDVASVHAGVTFPERIEGLKKFGAGEVPVLICTDLGARGLDLPICQHVVQLEFAKNTICYLHRVGRATRAANKSEVTNLWGDPDIAIKDLIMKAPQLGLEGEVVSLRGNRCRHRRVRRRQKRNEFVFSQTREKAQEARKRTQLSGAEWTARRDVVEKVAKA